MFRKKEPDYAKIESDLLLSESSRPSTDAWNTDLIRLQNIKTQNTAVTVGSSLICSGLLVAQSSIIVNAYNTSDVIPQVLRNTSIAGVVLGLVSMLIAMSIIFKGENSKLYMLYELYPYAVYPLCIYNIYLGVYVVYTIKANTTSVIGKQVRTGSSIILSISIAILIGLFIWDATHRRLSILAPPL